MPPDAVLITRPEPGATGTAGRVAAMGLIPIIAPFLGIKSFPCGHSHGRIAAVLLTSGNAVDPLAEYCRTLPVLAVGLATAQRAKQAGFKNVASAGGDAVALAALVRERVDPAAGTLLLACGRGQSLALAAELRASGYRVSRRVVYAAIPAANLPEAARTALLDPRTRTVLLFSTETARHFVRLVRRAGLLGSLSDRVAITIGPNAGMALSEMLWARVLVASEPTQDAMLALLR